MTTTTANSTPHIQALVPTKTPYRFQSGVRSTQWASGWNTSQARHDSSTSVAANSGHAEEALSITIHDLMLGWGMLQIYGETGVHSQPHQDAAAGRTLPERLAALLVGLCDEAGKLDGVSLQAFAGCLGTQRETVAAMLRAFQRQEFLRLSYQRIEITDLPALKEFADIWP